MYNGILSNRPTVYGGFWFGFENMFLIFIWISLLCVNVLFWIGWNDVKPTAIRVGLGRTTMWNIHEIQTEFKQMDETSTNVSVDSKMEKHFRIVSKNISMQTH